MNASAILLNGFFPSATIAGDETQVRVNNETAADANAIELVGDNSNFYLFDGGTLIVESQEQPQQCRRNKILHYL